MWQLCSGKNKLVIKLFTVWSQLYKKVYNIHIGIHRGKAVNGGYFWVVILSVFFLNVLYISVFFKFSTMTMYYNTEKHRSLKNSSDELIIRMYLDIINMWEQYHCAHLYNFYRVQHILLIINLHSLFVLYMLQHFNKKGNIVIRSLFVS